MSKIVLITNQVPENVTVPVRGLATVRMGGKGHTIMTRAELLEHAKDCTAIINQAELRVDKELLDALPKVEIIANISIGIDNLDLPEMTKHGVWATNAPGCFSQPVAEYVMGALIMLSRRVKEVDAFVRSGQWSSIEPGRWDGFGLYGRTLGIIGYGQIGRMLGTYAEAMGMKLITFSQGDEPSQFQKLLKESDYISVHVPRTPKTLDLIGEKDFALMKPGVILANASRGGIVNEPAMLAALRSGQLAGAMIDVFTEEPRVPEEFLTMPNVILSPHVCGGTKQSREQGRLCAFRNVADVLKGNRPTNALNNPIGR